MASDIVDMIAEPAASTPTPGEYERAINRVFAVDRPAWVEEFNRTHSWSSLLEGWTLAFTDRDYVEHWVRPGKDRRQGTSATVNYAHSDLLYVWSTSIPWLPSNRAYDRYGFMVHRDHGGDFKAAARAFMPQPPTTAPGINLLEEVDDDDDRTRIEQAEIPVSSESFWNSEDQDDELLIAPFIGTGKAHALYAEAKAGKSYVVLQAVAAASVPGHSSWAETPIEPVTILYLDYEMTENDLRERLETFGYGQNDDFSHFHYIKASMLGGDLDTYQGGQDLLLQAQKWNCALVVIDTMSRAVSGAENDSDPVRSFYEHTGRLLKANGIAWLRIDHAGKDKGKGQRGSSAKNDDVDVVWRLDRTDLGASMTLTHSRVFWMPPEISLRNVAQGDGSIVHELAESGDYPSGTGQKARQWLDLKLPIDASRRKVAGAGIPIRAADFPALKKYVRELSEKLEIESLTGSQKVVPSLALSKESRGNRTPENDGTTTENEG